MKSNSNRNLRRLLFPLLVPLGAVFFSLSSANLSADESTPTELALALIDAGKITQGQKALEQIAQTNEPSALVALFEFHRAGFFSRTDHSLAKNYLRQAVESGDQIARWRWATTARLNEGEINTQMLKELFDEGFKVASCHMEAGEIGLLEEDKSRVCNEARYALALSGNDRAIYDLWVADDPRYRELMYNFGPLRLQAYHSSFEWDNRPTEHNLQNLISSLRIGGLYSALLLAQRYEDAPADVAAEQDRLIKALDPKDQELIRNTLLDVAVGEKKGWFSDHLGSGFLGAIFREGRKELKIPADWGVAYELYGSCGRALTPGFCENWQGALLSNGGPNLEPNPTKALEHFSIAHELGDENATENLGDMYNFGEGVGLNFAKAAEFYQEALKRGNFSAAFNLAQLYVDGLGVDQDEVLAGELYTYAAEHAYEGSGNPMAMIMLGVLHEQNRLPNSDLFIALEWFKKGTVENPLYEQLTVGETGEVSYRALAQAGVNRVVEKIQQLNLATSDIDFGSYKALLIANENYNGLPNLKTPEEDVRLVGAILESRFGAEVEYLIDSSRSDLLSKLSQYRRELGPEDNFILYYAGHGVYDDELEVGYWQLSDAEADEDYSWVETDRVSRTLSAFKSRNVMIIADSCYSGSVVRGNATVGDLSSLAAIRSLNTKKSRVAITSGGLQPVLDAAGSSKYSAFAKNFAAALEGVYRPTPASALFTDLRIAVSTETAAWGFEQVPEFSPLYRAGHDGGDFILSPVSK